MRIAIARAAEEVTDQIIKAGGSASVACFDVSDTQATQRALTQILESGPIQVLVNNAGVYDDAPMAGMRADQWSHVIAVSLGGFFNVTQPLLLPMIGTRWGRSHHDFVGLGSARQSRPDELRSGQSGAPRRLEIACTGGRLPWRDRQCSCAGLHRITYGRAELQTRKDRGPCADEASRHASRGCLPGRIPGLREGRLYLGPSDRSQWGDGVNDHTPSRVDVMARYWVVIPAYNEAATIRDVASRAIRQMHACDRRRRWVYRWHGRSPDRFARGIVAKSHELWKGRQPMARLSAGMTAGAIGVVTLDGDGQHAPEDIPRLLAEAAFYPDHVIIGARRRDQRRAAFWRYIANRVADFWVSWAAGYSFADSQSGFRVYPASLLSRVQIAHEKARSFVFESEILIEAMRSGHRSLAVPIEALLRPGARPSYFRPVLDIARITCMVGWKLISKGMYPIGLYRSLFGQSFVSSEHRAVEEVAPARWAQPDPLSCETRSRAEEHEEALR